MELREQLKEIVMPSLVRLQKCDDEEEDLWGSIEGSIRAGDFYANCDLEIDGVFGRANVLIGLWAVMEFFLSNYDVPIRDYSSFVDQVHTFSCNGQIHAAFCRLPDGVLRQAYLWCHGKGTAFWGAEFDWGVDAMGRKVGFAVKRQQAGWFREYLAQIDLMADLAASGHIAMGTPSPG